MNIKWLKGKSIILLTSVFLFSQMNLPEKIVPKTTYDYMVNLSKFSLNRYDSQISDEEVNRFISLYEDAYFTKKSVTKRVRGLDGKRRYKKVLVITPRKEINLALETKLYKEYQWFNSSGSPLKDYVFLLYTDVLIAKGEYKKAEAALKTLSNSSVWDEAILRLATISYKNQDFSSLNYWLQQYLALKDTEKIYSPVYVALDAINRVQSNRISEGVELVYSLMRNDFTKEYIFVNHIVEFFDFLSTKKNLLSAEDIKKIKWICFEFLDNPKLFENAFKIANKISLGQEFLAEMLIEVKMKSNKRYSKLSNFLSSFWRNVIANPISIKNIEKYSPEAQAVIYKSLFIYYLNLGKLDLANEYFNKYATTTDLNFRLPKVADKFIDKLLLARRYDILASLLDNIGYNNFDYTSGADRLFFFKGYGAENLGKVEEAIKNYEKTTYFVPSGYYDFIAVRRINDLASDEYLKSYKSKLISLNTPQDEKINIAKILFSFDKENRDTYKSLVFFGIKDENKFLLDVPYKIFERISTDEKKKIFAIFKKITNNYQVTSRFLIEKLAYKGFSNVFSHVVIIRNRLEAGLMRGIYNEGNNLTSNKFIDAFSKFLPFGLQEVLYPIPYISEVLFSSEKFGLDPNLIYSVMKQESFFQEQVYSRAGAIGLMQVLYSTGKLVVNLLDLNDIELKSRQDLFKADANIIIGSAYISLLLSYYGDLYHAISAYNGGPKVISKTEKKYKVPVNESIVFSEFLTFRETRNYIKRVIKYYNVYSSIYNFEVAKKNLEVDKIKNLDELKEKMEKFDKEFGDYVPYGYDEDEGGN